MEINVGKRALFVGDDEKSAKTYITYVQDENDNYRIDHTYVDESLKGKGVAGKLVEAMIRKARYDEKKLVPVCPYVVKYFEKHPENKDILA